MLGGLMSITTIDGEEKLVQFAAIKLIEKGSVTLVNREWKTTVLITVDTGNESRVFKVLSNFDVLKLQLIGQVQVVKPVGRA